MASLPVFISNTLLMRFAHKAHLRSSFLFSSSILASCFQEAEIHSVFKQDIFVPPLHRYFCHTDINDWVGDVSDTIVLNSNE